MHTVRRTQYVGAPYEDARGLPHSTQPVTLGLRSGVEGSCVKRGKGERRGAQPG